MGEDPPRGIASFSNSRDKAHIQKIRISMGSLNRNLGIPKSIEQRLQIQRESDFHPESLDSAKRQSVTAEESCFQTIPCLKS